MQIFNSSRAMKLMAKREEAKKKWDAKVKEWDKNRQSDYGRSYAGVYSTPADTASCRAGQDKTSIANSVRWEQSIKDAARIRSEEEARIAREKLKIQQDAIVLREHEERVKAEQERAAEAKRKADIVAARKLNQSFEVDRSCDLLKGLTTEQVKQVLRISAELGLQGTSLGTELALEKFRSLPYTERETLYKRDAIDGEYRKA